MSDDIRWKKRFQNFQKALSTIEEIIPLFPQLNDLEKDGLIHRFEFTFDLSWKVMQDYIKFAGYVDLKGPRALITQMAQDNLLDPFVWIELLTARNELSHIYDEEISRNYLNKIVNDFFPAFKEFQNTMEKIL
jgi:nucleotidyltransferase substrate binding protein (TIGR01987 family)